MVVLRARRRLAGVFCFGLGVCAAACGLGPAARPALAQNATAAAQSPEFAKLADQLAANRAAETETSQATEQQALEMLDRAVLPSLNVSAADQAALNQRLSKFVTREPPLGEGFRVFALGGTPASFALLADFGGSGPSAVRIYAGAPGKLSLAARLDRYAQPDFLDDYIELVPIPGPAAVFVTVAGRTDDFKTGVFTAWHFDGHRVEQVWTSDIVSQSNYEVTPTGFQLDYCADDNPDDPRACHDIRRERFAWMDGAWKQSESMTLAPVGGGH